jgi:hypothetical protein
MPATEIIFVREPPTVSRLLAPEWIREFSGAAEVIPGGEQQDFTGHATTNRTQGHKAIIDLLVEASTRAFSASNIIAGISLMAVVGVGERCELVTTTKVGIGKLRSLTFANANNTDFGWDLGSIYSFLTSTTNEAAASEATARSKLIDRIIAERSVADIEPENVTVANAATDEAVALIQGTEISVMPRVIFSEDGILALQWQRGEYGVALIFAGNGAASISFRRPGQFYAENGIEVRISDGLPKEFADGLAKVLS